MPNYVRNVLILTGKKIDVTEALNSIKCEKRMFAMENILPIPANSPQDIYNWKITHWGATDAVDCIKSSENIIRFSTSWTPPLQVIEALAQKISAVKIKYYWASDDIGGDAGMQIWEEGKLIKELRPYTLAYYFCWGGLNQIA